MKPNARGLLLFFFLAVGTSAGAAETDSGQATLHAILQFLPWQGWKKEMVRSVPI